MKYNSKRYITIALMCGFTSVVCKEKWMGPSFFWQNICQQIQQGEKLSTSLYKCYKNDIFEFVTACGVRSHLGTISTVLHQYLYYWKWTAWLNGHCLKPYTVRPNQKQSTRLNLACYNTKQERLVNIESRLSLSDRQRYSCNTS